MWFAHLPPGSLEDRTICITFHSRRNQSTAEPSGSDIVLELIRSCPTHTSILQKTETRVVCSTPGLVNNWILLERRIMKSLSPGWLEAPGKCRANQAQLRRVVALLELGSSKTKPGVYELTHGDMVRSSETSLACPPNRSSAHISDIPFL